MRRTNSTDQNNLEGPADRFLESHSMPSDAEIVASETKRLNRAFGPVMAGLMIDAVDLATLGPIGVFVGLPIGGLAGYWMGRTLGLDQKSSLLCALAAGVYCTIPFTEVLPLGTLVGAFARYQQDEAEDRVAASDRN